MFHPDLSGIPQHEKQDSKSEKLLFISTDFTQSRRHPAPGLLALPLSLSGGETL